MKNYLSIVIIALFSFSAHSQFTLEELTEIGNTFKNYKDVQGRYDKHEGILWVRRINKLNSTKYTEFEGGKFYLYYGLKKVDGKIVKTRMRIKVTYTGSNWLFIDKISFALLTLEEGDDDLIQTFSVSCSDPTRNTRSGGIEEICDVLLPTEGLDFFKQMTELKRMTTIRLTGEKYIEKAMFRKKLNSNDELLRLYENEFEFQQ